MEYTTAIKQAVAKDCFFLLRFRILCPCFVLALRKRRVKPLQKGFYIFNSQDQQSNPNVPTYSKGIVLACGEQAGFGNLWAASDCYQNPYQSSLLTSWLHKAFDLAWLLIDASLTLLVQPKASLRRWAWLTPPTPQGAMPSLRSGKTHPPTPARSARGRQY